ncbi:MAG: acyl-CoA dehydrogenase [Streptosporangiales bacterium]|nr:acyl-CoA dehydrogenase [Streptosporangiales bacterium]
MARPPARGGRHGSGRPDDCPVPGSRGEGRLDAENRCPVTPDKAAEKARELAPRLAARADGYDRAGAFPAEDFADLRTAGLMGLMAPRRLGGVGASFADYTEVAMALAEGNGATALIYNMHASVTGALALTPDDVARALGATEGFFAARDRLLAATIREGAFYAVAMSERGVGSRLSQVRTAYRPEGGGWRISGSKTFCSGAGHADGYLVAARRSSDGEAVATEGAVSYFLVPAADGLTVEETWDSLGMRATASHDLHLDVLVPAEALLGGVEGLTLLLAQAMPQWLVASYAAVYVGVAEAAIRAAAADGRDRGLGRLPAVRSRLGRADAQVASAREAVREAARRVDADPGAPETNRWIWRAKLLAGETAMEVAASMLEACGAAATRRGNPLERLYRDARCGSLQPATSDVCADWLGCVALGLDPERDAEVPRW